MIQHRREIPLVRAGGDGMKDLAPNQFWWSEKHRRGYVVESIRDGFAFLNHVLDDGLMLWTGVKMAVGKATQELNDKAELITTDEQRRKIAARIKRA